MITQLELTASNLKAIEQAYDDCIANGFGNVVKELAAKIGTKSKESQLSICYGIATGDASEFGGLRVAALALMAILMGLRPALV